MNSTQGIDVKLLEENTDGPNTIYVFEDEDGSRSLKINHLAEVHSIWAPDEVLVLPVTEHYWNFFNLFLGISSKIRSVLILGLGAGTISRQLVEYFDDITIDGIENDAQVVAMGKEYFELDQEGVTLFEEDGLSFLGHSQKTYDLIVLDAFVKRNLSMDFMNEHTFETIKKRLSSSGFLAANYIFAVPLHRELKHLFKRFFKQVWRVNIKGTSNYIMFGSDHSWDIPGHRFDEEDIELKNLYTYIQENLEIIR